MFQQLFRKAKRAPLGADVKLSSAPNKNGRLFSAGRSHFSPPRF
jgi:hypothetical protein